MHVASVNDLLVYLLCVCRTFRAVATFFDDFNKFNHKFFSCFHICTCSLPTDTPIMEVESPTKPLKPSMVCSECFSWFFSFVHFQIQFKFSKILRALVSIIKRLIGILFSIWSSIHTASNFSISWMRPFHCLVIMAWYPVDAFTASFTLSLRIVEMVKCASSNSLAISLTFLPASQSLMILIFISRSIVFFLSTFCRCKHAFSFCWHGMYGQYLYSTSTHYITVLCIKTQNSTLYSKDIQQYSIKSI